MFGTFVWNLILVSLEIDIGIVWNSCMEIPLCLSCVGKILLEVLLVAIRLVLWVILSFD